MALACVPEVALAVARHVGCQVSRVGQSFLCPLHRERTPSAALWQEPGRPIRLHCFHTDEWWMLPDLYAVISTGKRRRLGKGERLLWWLRAVHETGCVEASPLVAPSLPPLAPPAARKLYAGFCYSLRLRALYAADQAGTPFTWSFAAHWCGIGSLTTVGEAMKWLLRHEYLQLVAEGRSGGAGVRRSGLFRLGEPPSSSEAARR